MSENAANDQNQPPLVNGTSAADDAVEPDADEDPELVESPILPELGGIYAPLMRLQHQHHVENSSIVPLPRRVIGGLRDQVEASLSCSCSKSNCLKVRTSCVHPASKAVVGSHQLSFKCVL